MSNKEKYLKTLEKLKGFSDDTTDEEVDVVLDLLDELWDEMTDDEKTYVNDLDNDDY